MLRCAPVQSISSGKTNRHRLNRGGDRQANAALYRIVVVRLRYDLRTQAYMRRRTDTPSKGSYSAIQKPNQMLDARGMYSFCRPVASSEYVTEIFFAASVTWASFISFCSAEAYTSCFATTMRIALSLR